MPIAPGRAAALLVLLLIALAGGCGGGGAMGSVGAVLGRDNDTRALYVRDVPEGLAADKAGLLPGDEIVMIDGVYARDLEGKQIKKKLRGEVGSTVDLTVLRANEVHRIRVTRAPLRESEEVRSKEERVEP